MENKIDFDKIVCDLEHTPGKWFIGPKPNYYKPSPKTKLEENLLEITNLNGDFLCLSIGTMDEQVALIPMDNPHAEANAKLMVQSNNLLMELMKVVSFMEKEENIQNKDSILKSSYEIIDKAISNV